MIETAATAFAHAMGLTPNQVKFLLRTGWVLAVTTFMAWGLGLLVWAGYPGPAKAAEVDALKGEVKSIQLQLLEQDLFDVRLRQCKADTLESRQFYYQKLQEKMNRYFSLTNTNYHVPDCKEIS